MEVYLVVCLLYMILPEIYGVTLVPSIPTLASNVPTPMTANTVTVEMPYCYFEDVYASACPSKNCGVWAVVSLTSATSKYDTFKQSTYFASYAEAFGPPENNFFTAPIDVLSTLPCPKNGNRNFEAGTVTDCSSILMCNGVLPTGSDVSIKYFLFHNGDVIAETPWSKNFALPPTIVSNKPTVSTDVATPVLYDTVSLQMPSCYFDSFAATQCPDPSKCEVWLVSSLTSATSNYDKNDSPNFFSKYPTAFNSTGNNYFTTFVNTVDKITCPAPSPYNFLVGADGACTGSYCNGVLPDGQNVSFKYVVVNNGDEVAETKWSDSIVLKKRKIADTLGSSYAGRSGAMVVITTILAITMALLFLLLLSTLILVCCCNKKTQSYQTNGKPSVIGSLRVPSYDVHNLKQRNTTNSTMPQ